MAYWQNKDIEVAQSDDLPIAMTWATSAGVAASVLAWDVYFKASGSHTTDTITVAPGSVVKSNSGSGTTDTFTVTLTSTLTNVDPGRYDYDIAVNTGSEKKVVLKGTLTVTERETAVT